MTPRPMLRRALAALPAAWRTDPLVPARFPRFASAAEAAFPADELGRIRGISMIAARTLAALRALAALAPGPALEIGPYRGGSTIALAGGLKPGLDLATIEVGGSYRSHPTLPSDDIIGDLTANLARHDLARRVTILRGRSHDPAIRAAAADWLGGRRIGLFFLDADLFPARNLLHFARSFAPDCLIAIDDYYVEDGSAKTGIVQAFVDQLVRCGALLPAGISHCTWFGRIAGQRGLARLLAMAEAPRFMADQGFCWIGDPRLDVAADYLLQADGSAAAGPLRLDPALRRALEDRAGRPGPGQVISIPASSLIVLEDGVPLPRPHALHDEIRRLGAGRYNHWTFRGGADRNGAPYREVLFSSTDNSDPNGNGRVYTARHGGREVPLCGI